MGLTPRKAIYVKAWHAASLCGVEVGRLMCTRGAIEVPHRQSDVL
jgi:hypothetical protein